MDDKQGLRTYTDPGTANVLLADAINALAKAITYYADVSSVETKLEREKYEYGLHKAEASAAMDRSSFPDGRREGCPGKDGRPADPEDVPPNVKGGPY